ncbi:MAG: hypothetical protein ACYDA2_08740 [Acidimicrobiales bacterium]
MDAQKLVERIGEQLSIGRAFGPAYERDGAVLVPVAAVMGGGGTDSRDVSAGAGFGGWVHPIGAYVLRDGDVRFVPALDVSLLALLGLGLLRLVLRRRRH